MDNLEGTSLGSYYLLYKIGQGGMADVYLAEQREQGEDVDRDGASHPSNQSQRVAVKVLPAVLARDPDFSQRFEREARFAASLQHPHILPTYSYSQDKGYPYLVMRYASGGTLATILKERHRLTPQEAEPYITQIGSALSYAHDQGIVHRDIKPSNLLLDEYGDIYLADFGIAKLLSQVTKLTKTGAGVGTPEYMAPEQVKGKADARSDIYSLGIVIYQMLTGEVPFTGETSLEIALKQLTLPIPPLKRYHAAIPLTVQIIVLRALEKDITRRYQKVEELVRAYQDALVSPSNSTRRPASSRQRLVAAEGPAKAGITTGQSAHAALSPESEKKTTPSFGDPEQAGEAGWELVRRNGNQGRINKDRSLPVRSDHRRLQGRRWLAGSAFILLLTGLSALLLREGLQSDTRFTTRAPTPTTEVSSLVPVSTTAPTAPSIHRSAAATRIPLRPRISATPTLVATAIQAATLVPTDVPSPVVVPPAVPAAQTPVSTPVPTATRVPAPTATSTPKPIPTPTSIQTPKPTASPSPAPTIVPTVLPTQVPSPLPTDTPTSVSPTPTGTGASPTPTSTGVPSIPASTPVPLAATATQVSLKPTATAVFPIPTGSSSILKASQLASSS